MQISFSRGLDSDKFEMQFSFGPEDFNRAFLGKSDPDDIFFQIMGPNLSLLGAEEAARLIASFAKLVTDAEATEQAALLAGTVGTPEPKP